VERSNPVPPSGFPEFQCRSYCKHSARSVQQVPQVVETLANYIRTNLNLEGLFRVAPEMQEAKDLKKYFDTGRHLTNPERLHDFSLHCAANVFKMYFREMPEPLIPSSYYDILLSPEVQQMSEQALIPFLAEQLQKIPPVHKVLLHYVLSFFTDVVAHSNKNMMTASNISIVFAANVIRPQVDTVESTLALPRVSKIFELILVNGSTWCHLLDDCPTQV